MGVVNTTYTFGPTDTITSSRMNNIIDETFFDSSAVDNSTIAIAANKLQVKTQGITSTQLADNAVTTGRITDLAVTTGKIADLAVTTGKITDSAVTTAKILDANVTTAKILDANVTAAKLNGAQTGPAPIYGVRAWVNFSGSTAANLTGTYSRVGNVVTVTASNHGLLVGHKVFLDFTSGAATDGAFLVATVADANTFTITHGTSGATNGNVSLLRRTIRAAGNVSNVSYLGTGEYAINFTVEMPSVNYARSGFASMVSDTSAGVLGGLLGSQTTVNSCDVATSSSNTGNLGDFGVVNVMFVG